jgi:hypothetical protein
VAGKPCSKRHSDLIGGKMLGTANGGKYGHFDDAIKFGLIHSLIALVGGAVLFYISWKFLSEFK